MRSSNKTQKRKPIGFWNEENIIKAIQDRYNNNYSLKVSDVQKEESGLFDAARKKFGNWKNAVNESGIDYDNKIKKRNVWSKEKIIEILKKDICKDCR